ncbi:nucleotidyltransferase domain-containing protein [Patescibacteria group bacterium]|nr:nucleotidyltransferase domain-containing protein [Candidatus Falkowbacteria bacterium]MBU3906322.1 nucleotidyltransferase domain-containing protein [Patescibacteria group bacterium]MCG2698486.1 nucleotidyltransferase domain-containing protein [Candidatus Parcubacteria bacterium]MBU4015231.1 nucleotidyltransferase domain-containing protein [Patescibacteria group bacterium]MBU4026956.1 nucleotidyltransferase domain-containing protein [Patescibacteria group bacterium]
MHRKKIPKKVSAEIKRYVKTLQEDDLPVKKVILFGSFAKGRQREWSDIDLCIISPKFKDAWSALEYLWSKRKIFDIKYTIEPIGFSPKDFQDKYDSLIQEIKTTGIEIPV